MEAFLGQVSRCQQQKGRGRQGPLLVPGKPHCRTASAPASPIPGVLGGAVGVTTSPHPARRSCRQVGPAPHSAQRLQALGKPPGWPDLRPLFPGSSGMAEPARRAREWRCPRLRYPRGCSHCPDRVATSSPVGTPRCVVLEQVGHFINSTVCARARARTDARTRTRAHAVPALRRSSVVGRPVSSAERRRTRRAQGETKTRGASWAPWRAHTGGHNVPSGNVPLPARPRPHGHSADQRSALESGREAAASRGRAWHPLLRRRRLVSPPRSTSRERGPAVGTAERGAVRSCVAVSGSAVWR